MSEYVVEPASIQLPLTISVDITEALRLASQAAREPAADSERSADGPDDCRRHGTCPPISADGRG